jgi:glucosamine--fructose-6-phosphate aminotransferase (isomerizing)
MCGIVAYIGKKEAYPVLIKGLTRLEYRGYDSAGIALLDGQSLNLYKKQGKVANLVAFTEGQNIHGNVGIGHTRWATHGEPNDINSHPHYSMDKRIAVIHNGIIENYDTLKKELIKRGYIFKSETDTEVLVHLIDDIQKTEKSSLVEAVRQALQSVVGAYALVVISVDNPTQLIAARKSSPLVVGIGEDNEFFLASDATPIVEYTNQVVYLNDEEMAVVHINEGLRLTNI